MLECCKIVAKVILPTEQDSRLDLSGDGKISVKDLSSGAKWLNNAPHFKMKISAEQFLSLVDEAITKQADGFACEGDKSEWYVTVT